MPSLELILSFLAPQVVLFLLFGVGALATALTMLLHPNPVRAALFLVLNLFCVAVLYLLLNAYFLAAVQVVVYAGAIMVLFLFVIMLLNLGTPDRTQDRLRGQQPFAVLAGLALAGIVAFSVVSATTFPRLDANGNPPERKKSGDLVAKRMKMMEGVSTDAGIGNNSGNPPSPAPSDVAESSSSSPADALPAPLPEAKSVPVQEQGTVAGIGRKLYDPALPYLFPFEVTSILLLVAAIGSVVLAKRATAEETALTQEELA